MLEIMLYLADDSPASLWAVSGFNLVAAVAFAVAGLSYCLDAVMALHVVYYAIVGYTAARGYARYRIQVCA